MSGVNKVILIGRLGQDPDLKTLPTGVMVCNLAVATSDTYTNSNGDKVEKTEWHKVVVYNQQADNAATYLKKGSQVYVEGKNATRSWDAEDGSKRYVTEVIAFIVNYLDSKRDA